MDLLYHFLAGIAIASTVILLACNVKDKTLVVSNFMALGGGVFKELIIDHWLRDMPMSAADVTLTWCGGMAVLFSIKIFELFKK